MQGMTNPLNELTTGDIMEGVGTPNVDDLSDDGPLIIPPDSVEAVSSVPITYGKRKRRSSVWEGFKVIPGDKYDDGKERAECLKCKIVYRADTCINGTGTLRRHLKNYPKQDNKDVKQMMLGNQGKMELRERNIDLNLVRDKITRLIVKRELPLKFVEHEEFRDLLSYICPEYCHISRNTQMAQLTSLILGTALVFDPRYKFAFVDWAFRKIALKDPLAYDMSLHVKNALVKLFTAYKTMDAAGIKASTPSFSYIGPAELEEFSTFDSAMLIDRYGKSQLDYYLEEPKLPFDDKYRQFDVLAYWRQNGSKYSDVARMAKDFLFIPVSTVASESAFSAGGRVIDMYRSKLLPSNAEALICLWDWMFDIDFRAEPVDDAEDVAMSLGNVLITDDLPMLANLVASTVPLSSSLSNLQFWCYSNGQWLKYVDASVTAVGISKDVANEMVVEMQASQIEHGKLK
ncbi:hypothetical protein NE237_001298 [Protea cynaroides]|uniref:BED-type domain-containing protein n=1 Tax=Protea cynaroides TaxID=273540 RepID=A0A9Q0KSU6_9MAGN|nr:hypothetical protein NE237_001298 [Protea cynaroides]